MLPNRQNRIGRLALLLLVTATTLCHAIPKPDDIPVAATGHSRVIDELSHAQHFQNEAHNTKYDHEAFLGEDEAKSFDELAPEESQRRLGVIVGKIDEDKDGFVTLYELQMWIKYSQSRYIDNDVSTQWKLHNKNGSEQLHWETYRTSVYGFMDEMDPADLDSDKDSRTYKSILTRDRRRWSVADRDGDDLLTKAEFTEFLHPEEYPRMRDITVAETLEDIDKNNDGKLSVDEYIGDMYRGAAEGEEEPQWVRNERETFSMFRDKDSDGYMNYEEVKNWVVPQDFDHAEAEARHLINEADTNADEKLTREEVLAKYDLFVGSQATDFGEALTRHEEF